MGQLRLNTLGRFEAKLASGEALTLPTRKAEVLLTYLALSAGQIESRERLRDLLWSDRGEDQASNSLRQTLSALKKSLQAINPSPLKIDRISVSLVPGIIEIDALELEHLARDNSAQSVAAAVRLYRGEFLEAVVVRDGNAEDWLAGERARYRRMGVSALEQLLAGQSAAGELQLAVETGERLILLDPLNETNWRRLMTVYALRDERNKALLAYNRCVDILRQQLGVEPEQETIDLQASIRNGRLNLSTRPAVGEAQNERAAAAATALDSPAPPLPDKPSIVVLPFVNLRKAGLAN